MRFGLDVSQHQRRWPEILERVRYAEQAGFEGAWVFDHFKPLYGDPGGPCLEAYTLMSALAASTDRIRLGALVTGVTYRHPSILAAEAAAWFEQEHRELGIPFPSTRERFERLDEALQVIRLLLTEDGASFEGRHFRLDRATYHPRPVQQPHPPIWVGAGGERLGIPIAARHADAWHSFGSVETLRRKSAVLEQHAEKAGRDPGSIVRATDLSLSEPWDEVRERIQALSQAGFSYLVVSWPSEGRGRLEGFVEQVLPDFR